MPVLTFKYAIATPVFQPKQKFFRFLSYIVTSPKIDPKVPLRARKCPSRRNLEI